MKFKLILPVIVLSLLGGFIGAKLGEGSKTSEKHENAFERVMRTGVLRCGYYMFPPVTYKDPNTGKMSGFTVDMMNKIADKAGLKIEWAEEVNFGNWQQGLQTGRFDVACTPNWPTTSMGRVVIFSKPMMYAKIIPIGKAGDTRFKSLEDLNRPEVRISVYEGNEIIALAREILPKATLVILPPNAEGTQAVMDVLSGKADIILSDGNQIGQWNKNNVQKIGPVAGGAVLKAMPFTLGVGAHEVELNNFLNNAIDDLVLNGSMGRLMNQWMEFKDVFLLPAKPYAE